MDASKQPLKSRSSIIPPSYFAKPRFPKPELDSSRKMFLAAAARGIGMDPKEFASWIVKRSPKEERGGDGKKRLRVDLSMNFAVRPFFVEEKVGFNSFIQETSVETVRAYFSLRERIRKKELIPVSEGFGGRDKKYMDLAREFIQPRIRFEKNPDEPFLFFAKQQMPRLRVPIYEMNGNLYCEPRHAAPIAFASRLECASGISKSREAAKVASEISRYPEPENIPYELGLKIWILRAYSLRHDPGLRDFNYGFFYSKALREFFTMAGRDYLSNLA